MKKLFSLFFRRFTKNLEVEEPKEILSPKVETSALIAELGQLTKSMGETYKRILKSQEEILKPSPLLDKKEDKEVTNNLEETPQEISSSQETSNLPTQEETKKTIVKKSKKKSLKSLTTFDPRDIMETMGIPFVALSKNRTAPIIYESLDGTTKVRISRHFPHYVASIYDLDIIQFVSGKMQEIINDHSDMPPRTIIFPRHELFKAIRKQDGKKEKKDLKSSLSRLQTTVIETTICNKDGRYDAGFGFLDSWSYTDRKDVKEIKITLSDWLYEVVCSKGALLKFPSEYFEITSGLKKALYRIARKHVGTKNKSWIFSIEELHKKSGSERDLRKFKHDLQKTISDNDIPGYFIEWVEVDGIPSVRFVNKIKELKEMLSRGGVRESE